MALSILVCAVLLSFYFLKPIALYLYDPKSLRRYPNQNLLSGITTLSYIWERINYPFRSRGLHLQHQKHPVIRTGPNTLSFSDVGAIKDTYGHQAAFCRKDDVYTVGGPTFHLLSVVDREEHARKRKMLSNAFATKNLEQWEYKISQKTGKLLAQLDRRCNESVDLRKWLNLFTVDSIVDIVLSEKLRMLDSGRDMVILDDGEELGFVNSLHRGGRMSSIIVGATDWFPLLKVWSGWVSAYWRSQWEHGRNFGKIVRHLASRRLQGPDELNDITTCLIVDKMGNPRCLDREEIEAEMSILVDAGSDTTAIALTHVLYYLIKNPHTLKALREEIAAAIPDCHIAPYAQVKNLPYLKACLDESLRLSPPISRGLERRTPPEGMSILGEFIPGDTGVSISAYVAHRDPEIFAEPEMYRPERWLDSGEETIKRMRSVFIPFSTGGRGCIGRNIAMMEQQILIATLVHRYEFSLLSDSWELDWEEAFNLWPAQMPLKMRQRHM